MKTASEQAKILVKRLSQCSCKEVETIGSITVNAAIHFRGYISKIQIVIPKKDTRAISIWSEDNCILPEIEPMIRQIIDRG